MNEYSDFKIIVKSYYDFQKMRIRLANRLERKKDGSSQKENKKTNYKTKVEREDDNIKFLEIFFDDIKKTEETFLKDIKKIVHKTALWQNYLKDIKGVGELMAAVIMSEFDIYKATTVSKMWAYAGLSPGTTYGKKWNKDKTKIITTDIIVKQDRKTSGFLCPYNQFLKSKLLGVLADQFIRKENPYRKHYEDYRHRLESKDWGTESKNPSTKNKKAGHQNNAAKRHIVKLFIIELYVAWRTLEGLPVRNLYAEEYLGKKHSA